MNKIEKNLDMEYVTFKDLGLNDTFLKAIEKKGFEIPSPIQVQSIPVILNTQSDILAQAQTGTGKTAAFGLPILQLLKKEDKVVKTLILVPTRELAIQVSEELYSLKGTQKLKILPIYGGSSIERQIKNLKDGVDIVVATPGRAIDLMARKALKLYDIQFLVLDEADEMLNMGFIEDIELILQNTNDTKRMFLFSATMPAKIKSISNKYMKDVEYIQVKSKELTTNLTYQKYYEVANKDKFEVLTRILDFENDFYGIIFCRTKSDVDDVSNRLMERGYDAEGLHGDLSQYQRERIFKKFKTRTISILVATDVAARGLDVNDLTHVINYAIPQDAESYVHRIGRTGRAGKAGVAITFVTKSEYQQLFYIQKITKTKIVKEQIPAIQEILDQKKDKLFFDIQDIIESGDDINEFESITSALLSSYDSKIVIKSILKYFLKESMNEENYTEISSLSANSNGMRRLFIARGKIDGLSNKKLVSEIQKIIEINSNEIKDIKVLNEFSFITVPDEYAQILIYIMNKGSKREIVTYAKVDKNSNSKSKEKEKLQKNSKNQIKEKGKQNTNKLKIKDNSKSNK